jgi:hypothetical protein
MSPATPTRWIDETEDGLSRFGLGRARREGAIVEAGTGCDVGAVG